MINREFVVEQFNKYVEPYDISDPKIRLKVEHTTRVAQITDLITKSLELDNADCELAWLIGMLHDIGRFEQVKRYNTFSDADSVDHAVLGCSILFEENKVHDFAKLSEEDLRSVYAAISNHNSYRIDDSLSDRNKVLCRIIRDADKLDIMRANAEFSLEEVYNVSTYEVLHSEVSDEVMKAFDEGHAILRNLKKTAADCRVGIISLAYELEYTESYKILADQGYFYKLLDYRSENEHTVKQFDYIKQKMLELIELKCLS